MSQKSKRRGKRQVGVFGQLLRVLPAGTRLEHLADGVWQATKYREASITVADSEGRLKTKTVLTAEVQGRESRDKVQALQSFILNLLKTLKGENNDLSSNAEPDAGPDVPSTGNENTTVDTETLSVETSQNLQPAPAI